MVSRYVAFLNDENQGITYSDFLAMADRELEFSHSFIQWIFPLAEPSRFNSDAPVLDLAELSVKIQSDPTIVDKLNQSVDKMLAFWGIGADLSVIDPLKARSLDRHNHNALRFSRMLRSLVYHGQDARAASILAVVEALPFLNPGRASSGDTLWAVNLQEAKEKLNALNN